MKNLMLAALIVTILLACQKEDNCVPEEVMFTLSEKTNSFFPYEEDIEHLVFVDSLHNEYVFITQESNFGSKERTVSSICEETGEEVEYTVFTDVNGLVFYCESLETSIQVTIYTLLVRPEVGFIYSIDVFDVVVANGEDFTLLRDITDYNGNSDFNASFVVSMADSLTILGQQFTDVMFKDYSEFNRFAVYYTKTQGVVGFRDNKEPTKTYRLKI